MFLKHRRKARRPGSWLAVLAVLIQALMPALHHPAGMAMAGMPGFADAVNMCLAPGSTAPGDHDKAPAHQMPACALCQAVHAMGGFAPPTVSIALAVRSDVKVAFTATETVSVPQPAFRSNAQPRAPPTLA